MSRTVTDPQPKLFFCWLITGKLSIMGSLIWLICQPSLLTKPALEPIVVAWVHLLVLGWLSSLFFAAGYQLIPVVTLNPIGSRWMARIHFALHGIGFLTMVHSFASTNYPLLATGGTLVFLGFILFVINALISSGFQSKWNHLNILWFLALFWLIAGGCLAMFTVYIKVYPSSAFSYFDVLGLHIHTMLIGFFFTLLTAATSKLVPMFMLSPEKNQIGTWIAGILPTIVLGISYFSIGKAQQLSSILAVAMIAAILAYYGQLLYFVLNKRKALDAGLTLFLLGTLFLIPAWYGFFSFHNSAASDQTFLRNGIFALVVLVFNGCILGMAQKIVPFMMWHHLYAKHLGRMKVPQTGDLLVSWTLWPIAALFVISGGLFCSALFLDAPALIRPAALSMIAAYAFFILNAPRFIEHWKSPKLESFQPPSL